MHKILLIHNDNTPLKNIISNQIIFNPTIDDLNNSDIDKYISHEVIPQIQDRGFDVICIKDTLSENYIDFYGLVLAYHIRLSRELNENRLLPIVILSEINSYTINKISPIGNILFTKNVFLLENTLDSVEKIESLVLTKLSREEFQANFLDKIEIKPPMDYTDHHNITNEWAIFHWSNLLGLSTKTIDENTKKISSMLYFKYLIAKHHLQIKSKGKIKQTNKEGKILLIDDRWNDGWKDIINEFVSQQYTKVDLDTLEYIYKDKMIEDIKNGVSEEIHSSNPDLILLDLRLMESDNFLGNDKKSISNISGFQIINEIKNINPGIQIVMFTASGDSLILDELYNKGIVGYVKKDAPTDKYETSKNSFNKLDTLIKKGIDRNYLKKVWQLEKEILEQSFLKNTKKLSNEDELTIYELRRNIKFVFETLNSNIPNPFTYAMLSIFKCIELINDYYILDRYKEALWKDTKKGIDKHEDNSTKNKILNIIDNKTNLQKNDIKIDIMTIICSRNYTIHPREKESCKDILIKEPKAEHIVKWLHMFKEIISTLKDTNEKNI